VCTNANKDGGEQGGQVETTENQEAGDQGASVKGGESGNAKAAAEDALAAETLCADSAENGEQSGFSVERCMPCWPLYYEGIEPRVASVARAELAGEEEHEGGGDSDSDTEGGAGTAGLLQIIALLHGLAPGDVVALPNGQHILTADLLGALVNQGDDGGDDDDDDDDGGGEVADDDAARVQDSSRLPESGANGTAAASLDATIRGGVEVVEEAAMVGGGGEGGNEMGGAEGVGLEDPLS